MGKLTFLGMGLLGAATMAAGQVGPRGYLLPDAFDILRVLPPAPFTGDARDMADRAIFRSTRALQGTRRWDMATNDVKLSPGDMMRDFSCAVGVTLTPERAPLTAALMRRGGVRHGTREFHRQELLQAAAAVPQRSRSDMPVADRGCGQLRLSVRAHHRGLDVGDVARRNRAGPGHADPGARSCLW